MLRLKNLFFTLVVGLFATVLTGCEPATPIAVYVTPTPVGGGSEGAPAQLSAFDEQRVAQNATPIATVGLLAPAATSTPTLTPTLTPEGEDGRGGDTIEIDSAIDDGAVDADDSGTTPEPAATFLGPVIGPDYTLPPTETPRPTATPTEGPPPTDTPEPTPRGTPLPLLDAGQMGIQLDAGLSREDWDNAILRLDDHLTTDWVKVQVSWERVQPNGRGEFGFEFETLQQYLLDASFRGKKIMVSIAKAPGWARSNTAEDGPPDNPQDLADFISTLLVTMEAAPGVSRINAVEIWNEPNLIREWQGAPHNGAAYMRLFVPSYNAIRAYSSDIIVVTAGLAPTGENPGSRDDRQFLREMYAAGLANYGSDVVVGVHPYGWGNAPDETCCGDQGWDDDPHFFFLDTIREYRDIMVANGHGAAQMWGTEFGWATWDDLPGDPPQPWMAFNDEWDQAHYTMRAFQIAQETDYIGVMFLWNLNFALLEPLVEQRDERVAYSMVLPGGERPIYWMIFDALREDVELDSF